MLLIHGTNSQRVGAICNSDHRHDTQYVARTSPLPIVLHAKAPVSLFQTDSRRM
jgi:hypothetical protein